ncbi:hypothetical protein BDQ17DRAFT_1328258 [Cyathus striatus]|nr:hypothetical protein BDQ17DRAFT_1328258 [Cyathus striatus]
MCTDGMKRRGGEGGRCSPWANGSQNVRTSTYCVVGRMLSLWSQGRGLPPATPTTTVIPVPFTLVTASVGAVTINDSKNAETLSGAPSGFESHHDVQGPLITRIWEGVRGYFDGDEEEEWNMSLKFLLEFSASTVSTPALTPLIIHINNARWMLTAPQMGVIHAMCVWVLA